MRRLARCKGELQIRRMRILKLTGFSRRQKRARSPWHRGGTIRLYSASLQASSASAWHGSTCIAPQTASRAWPGVFMGEASLPSAGLQCKRLSGCTRRGRMSCSQTARPWAASSRFAQPWTQADGYKAPGIRARASARPRVQRGAQTASPTGRGRASTSPHASMVRVPSQLQKSEEPWPCRRSSRRERPGRDAKDESVPESGPSCCTSSGGRLSPAGNSGARPGCNSESA